MRGSLGNRPAGGDASASPGGTNAYSPRRPRGSPGKASAPSSASHAGCEIATRKSREKVKRVVNKKTDIYLPHDCITLKSHSIRVLRRCLKHSARRLSRRSNSRHRLEWRHATGGAGIRRTLGT